MASASIANDEARCRRCRYALRGLDSRLCPECGTSFDPADPSTWWKPRFEQRLMRVPFASASRLATIVGWLWLIALYWAALWLPGGTVVSNSVGMLAAVTIGLEWLVKCVQASRGAVLDVTPLWVLLHKRWRFFAAVAAALYLYFSAAGASITIRMLSPYLMTDAWHLWTEVPAQDARVQSIRSCYPIVWGYVSPNGVSIHIPNCGTIWVTDDARGEPVMRIRSAAYDDLQRHFP